MINIYDPKHKHHALWKQLMQNLLDGNEPLKVEVEFSGGSVQTASIDHNGMPTCAWSENVAYRIKPKMKVLVVNGNVFKFQEPATYVECNHPYWLASVSGVDARINVHQPLTDKQLELGIVHLTEAAAKEHSEVLKKICKL